MSEHGYCQVSRNTWKKDDTWVMDAHPANFILTEKGILPIDQVVATSAQLKRIGEELRRYEKVDARLT